MSRETFPNWQPGGDIHARDLRELGRAARAGSTPDVACYTDGHKTAQIPNKSDRPVVLIITEIVDADLKTYKARPMWYNDGLEYGETTSLEAGDPTWEDNEDFIDFEWDVDGAAINSTLAVDDQIVAYWHDQRQAYVPMGGGGGGACTPQNAIHQITIFGMPTGGTFDMNLIVNGVAQTLTFNWDDNNAGVEAELITHAEIADGDVVATAGPFPNATIQYEFQGGLENTPVALPTLAFSGLTGGTGVGVLASMAQLGVS